MHNNGRCYSKKVSLKISFLYILLSIIWIYSTDWILSVSDELHIVWVSTIKAFFL